MGCIARNCLGEVMNDYNTKWAQWLRTCCLGILLALGGMTIIFRGKGLMVETMTLIPLFYEASTVALSNRMQIEIAYT